MQTIEKEEKKLTPHKLIPIVVGVTGFKDIFDEHKPKLKELVRKSLLKIQEMCKAKKKNEVDTPIIMLNDLAEGAGILCAEVARELNIPIYAILPSDIDKYSKSFRDKDDQNKFDSYKKSAERLIFVPDIENRKDWINRNDNIPNKPTMTDTIYQYREIGIYIAEHSHILIALWDGKANIRKFGYGTDKVIDFTLDHNYLDRDKLLYPGKVNDSAVIWINTPENVDKYNNTLNSEKRVYNSEDITMKWLADEPDSKYDNYYKICNDPPLYLKDIINETKKYNSEKVSIPDKNKKLWDGDECLTQYPIDLRYHYTKADQISYNKNQSIYITNIFLDLQY